MVLQDGELGQKSPWRYCRQLGALPPEVDHEGNIEYKLKLIDPSPERLEHLVTQLKWRLSEGDGEAVYELGVDDDGTLIGLSPEDMQASLDTLRRMASTLDAEITILRRVLIDDLMSPVPSFSKPGNQLIEALVRKRPSNEPEMFSDIRIAIIGGHGEGKSTLLGYIAHGIKDNGRGLARLNLLRHRHEIESGRTSSISHEIIGYDTKGDLINYATTHISTWEQVCEASTKVIVFLDTCGHPKYLRTTISALTGYAPDYACLVVSATLGNVSDMTREHLQVAVMLNIPVFVVVTKVDIATRKQLTSTLSALSSILKAPGLNKTPVVVKSETECHKMASALAEGGREIPVFLVSSVAGVNIKQLERFMNGLPKPTKHPDDRHDEPVEFQIKDVYSISDTNGPIIGGVLRRGCISTRDDISKRTYALGPNTKGEFVRVVVESIHRHRIPVHHVHSGQAATLEIQSPGLADWRIQKGMVLLDVDNPESYFEFEAEIIVLYHPAGLSVGSSGMIHAGSVRHQARVISVSLDREGTSEPMLPRDKTVDNNHKDSLIKRKRTSAKEKDHDPDTYPTTISSGQQGHCVFRFLNVPKYIRPESQILFIEGKAKCLGRITRVIPMAK